MRFDPDKMRSARESAEVRLKKLEERDPETEELAAACGQILAHMRFAEETYKEMLTSAKALADEMLP